jgi:hypothetical protein
VPPGGNYRMLMRPVIVGTEQSSRSPTMTRLWTRLSAISVPSSDPREQKPIAKGPDEVVLGARADSCYRDDQGNQAHNDHCL